MEPVGSSPSLKAFTDSTKNIPRDTVDTTARDLLVFLDAFVEPILNKFSFFILAVFFRCMENIKMKPIKGQLLHIKTNKKLINNILIYKNYYIVQREDNEIVVGATLEDVGFDTDLTESGKNFLEECLSDLLLERVETSNLEQTFGFRPYADKNEPYVSLDPNNKKIIYNFGHYRYGILTAIPSAQIVKRLVS